MYITYTDDDRIVVSQNRLTKKQIEKFRSQGVLFIEAFEDIEYEKHGDILLIETSTHISVDNL